MSGWSEFRLRLVRDPAFIELLLSAYLLGWAYVVRWPLAETGVGMSLRALSALDGMLLWIILAGLGVCRAGIAVFGAVVLRFYFAAVCGSVWAGLMVYLSGRVVVGPNSGLVLAWLLECYIAWRLYVIDRCNRQRIP